MFRPLTMSQPTPGPAAEAEPGAGAAEPAADDGAALELEELRAELAEWAERAENAEGDAAAMRTRASAGDAARAELQRTLAAAEARADAAEERARAAEASAADLA